MFCVQFVPQLWSKSLSPVSRLLPNKAVKLCRLMYWQARWQGATATTINLPNNTTTPTHSPLLLLLHYTTSSFYSCSSASCVLHFIFAFYSLAAIMNRLKNKWTLNSFSFQRCATLKREKRLTLNMHMTHDTHL